MPNAIVIRERVVIVIVIVDVVGVDKSDDVEDDDGNKVKKATPKQDIPSMAPIDPPEPAGNPPPVVAKK